MSWKNLMINIDCLKGIKEFAESGGVIDGVITSPPYNIVRPNSTDRGYDEYKDGKSNEEYSKWIVNIFNEVDKCLAKNGKIIMNLSYGTENTECMSLTIADILRKTNFTLADIIVWKKKSATPNNVSQNKLTRICEFIYVFCRREEFMTFKTNKKVVSVRETGQPCYENLFNFITAKNNDENCPLNKANYSTELVHKLLNIYFKQGDVIMDMFGGTGTTIVACRQRGIDCVSFELSAEQTKWANKRIERESSQMTIFDFTKEQNE